MDTLKSFYSNLLYTKRSELLEKTFKEQDELIQKNNQYNKIKTIEQLLCKIQLNNNGNYYTNNFFIAYLDNPFTIEEFRHGNIVNNFVELRSKKKYVRLIEIDMIWKLKQNDYAATVAVSGLYEKMMFVFFNNCYKFKYKNNFNSYDCQKVFQININGDDETFDFSPVSITALSFQLQDIAHSVFPQQLVPHIYKFEIRNLLNALPPLHGHVGNAKFIRQNIVFLEKLLFDTLKSSIKRNQDIGKL